MKGDCAMTYVTKLLAGAMVAATVSPALAGSDLLVRQRAPSFKACVAVQDQMMRNLGVEPAMLSVETDTGAMLERRYATNDAELVLSCNRVTDMLEVRRETPAIPAAVVASGAVVRL